VFAGVVALAATACGAEDKSTDAPDLPTGAVAVVADAPGCETSEGASCVITRDEFDHSIQQAAIRQGMRQAPASDDPRYEPLRDAAVDDLLLAAWVRGEAAERGLEISDREIDEELRAVIESPDFGSQKAFDRFLEQSGFTEEEARARLELQVISDRIQSEVLSAGGNAEELQELTQQFQSEFQEKWRARTTCADGFLTERCANGPPPTRQEGGEDGVAGGLP
jgi:SurA N-terminal domain